jgi:hypothetical protein
MTNSERTVEEVEGEIDQLVVEFRSSGWNGTEAGINLGERLVEWEPYIPKRQCGRSEKAKWGLSKATSARVRVLANNASLIRQEYNKGKSSKLPDPITFMGVYTWTQKEIGNFKPRPRSVKARSNGSTSDTDGAVDTADDIAALRRELREALNRIKELEEKLADRSDDLDQDSVDEDIVDLEPVVSALDKRSADGAFEHGQDAMAESRLGENNSAAVATRSKGRLDQLPPEVLSRLHKRFLKAPAGL